MKLDEQQQKTYEQAKGAYVSALIGAMPSLGLANAYRTITEPSLLDKKNSEAQQARRRLVQTLHHAFGSDVAAGLLRIDMKTYNRMINDNTKKGVRSYFAS